jgi:hypothetical protein
MVRILFFLLLPLLVVVLAVKVSMLDQTAGQVVEAGLEAHHIQQGLALLGKAMLVVRELPLLHKAGVAVELVQ